MTEKSQDSTIKERIIGLLRKGYSRSQLINDFTFAERTVDNAIREYKELYGNDPGEAQKVTEPEGRELVLPAKLDGKQVIVPEYLIQHLSFVDGDKRQSFIDGMLVLEAARRTVMEDVIVLQGLAEAQSKMTETQLNILRAAKSESGEVARHAAQEAAQEAAARVAAYFEQKNPDIAPTPDPMTGFMARAMETLWNQITARMFGGGQPGQTQLPPGWKDLREKGQG
jgi:hypothetical protein